MSTLEQLMGKDAGRFLLNHLLTKFSDSFIKHGYDATKDFNGPVDEAIAVFDQAIGKSICDALEHVMMTLNPTEAARIIARAAIDRVLAKSMPGGG